MSGYVTPRPPPLVTTKSNSLSLPDSPNALGQMRGRSNSLRVSTPRRSRNAALDVTLAKAAQSIQFLSPQIDSDILLRRSNSLRQGLPNIGHNHGRRKSSLEEIGISHFATLMQAANHSNPIKIALNGSIGLEVACKTGLFHPLSVCVCVCLSATKPTDYIK